ncbi:uncharacterized protein BXIN_2239 [Babesia sp. Xinjiang]|uniref:uncharacterized protein n=1 Tax=Babesia sp. Xinjiang TaxID=462227 RepID=UPI000A21C7A1|nr:uncharacterized protein BXIN_2239 [Babesia sp. Xinjiang]ORM40774.1 hypothetical protein BXIN_2239 [Babesia sp. Xinjiang]
MEAVNPNKRDIEGPLSEIRKLRKSESFASREPTLSNLPFVKLWKRQPDAWRSESEISSLSEISRISQSPGSVSAVSSSDSTGDSLEEGEIEEKGTAPNLDTTLTGGMLDNALDLDTHIAANSRHVKRMKLLTKIIGTKRGVSSLHTEGLRILKGSHLAVSTLASVFMMVKSIKANSVLRDITECFKELYSAVASFHAKILNINGYEGFKAIVVFAPYSIDMLMTMLPNLISCLRDQKTQKKFIVLFQALIHSTLLRCCSISDHYKDEIKIGAVKSTFSILKTLLPISLILTESPGDVAYGEIDLQGKRRELLHSMLNEYIRGEEFIPSSLLLLQLQRTLGISMTQMGPASTSSDELIRKASYRIGKICVVVGCTKRQFPVAYFHSSHYGLDEVSKVVTDSKKKGCYPKYLASDTNWGDEGRLWHKAKYWLLLLLEDNNVHIRNLALRIIRHAIVTIPMTEKDRQHILSLVTDCVSDDATFNCAMEVVVSASHLYPLKDGAVRRISNLTLKGCGIYSRVEVIRHFARCHFTRKGAETVMSIMHSLCEPVNVSETKTVNTQCATSSISNSDTEMFFTSVEWPEIMKFLVYIQRQWHGIGLFNYGTKSIKGVQRCGNTWIRPPWFHLMEQNTEPHFMSAICRSEASLRFPGVVSVKSNRTEIDLLIEARKILTMFSGFSKYNVKVECLRGKFVFLYLHRLRVRGVTHTIHKVLDSCQSDSKVVSNADIGKKCRCVDCSMDKFIVSSKLKKAINNVNNKAECSVYDKFHGYGTELQPVKNTNVVPSPANNFRWIAIFRYYRDISKFRGETYEAIDDLEYVEFPAHLGAALSRSVKVRPLNQKYLVLNIRSPCIINGCNRNARVSLKLRRRSMKRSAVALKLQITNGTPTLYPVPITLSLPLQSSVTNKVVRSQTNVLTMCQAFHRARPIWVHSKRVSR